MAEKQLKLLVLALIYLNITNANVIVETKSGLVSGKEVSSILPDEKYYSFLGIPYAEPPVGELRFMVSYMTYYSILKYIRINIGVCW